MNWQLYDELLTLAKIREKIMGKIFLSHSSTDKDSCVRPVVNHLDKADVIYDEITFEEGAKTLDEILTALGETDLFVLFISEASLNSEWVLRELKEAKQRKDQGVIKRIFPIVIDSGITHDDPRIPEWLRNSYNLRPIVRAPVIARRIIDKLRQLRWQTDSVLKASETLFVGRNSKLEEFERRIFSHSMAKPHFVLVSGLQGVGRRTFLLNALKKTRIIREGISLPTILLDRNSSIEDFILKLNDLGYTETSARIDDLINSSMEDKLALAAELINGIDHTRSKIVIVDDGCIINYKRSVADWFVALSRHSNIDWPPAITFACKYRVDFSKRPKGERFFFMELPELDYDERARLLAQLLSIYGITLGQEEFSSIHSLLSGMPGQAIYAADLLRNDTTSSFGDKCVTLREFSQDTASKLLLPFHEDSEKMAFIRLLAEFEVITVRFLFRISDERKHHSLLQELAAQHLVEFIGAEGEIVKLTDVIRDFIRRNEFKLDDGFRERLRVETSNMLHTEGFFELDSSEISATLVEQAKQGVDIHEHFLAPSHYLQCMKELYYVKGNLDRVIELADLLLQKEDSIDDGIAQDVRYYLCLALSRKKNKRVLSEAKKVRGPEHSFLLGYYYRIVGRAADAIERLKPLQDEKFVGNRARRELVQVYLQIEDFDSALDLARDNFERNQGNAFHIHAYLNCLMNSREARQKKGLLENLIVRLKSIDSDQAREMAMTAEAEFAARIDNDYEKAIRIATDAHHTFPESHYPALTVCQIGVLAKDHVVIEQGLALLDNRSKNQRLSQFSRIRFRAIGMALNGDRTGAIALVRRDSKGIPESAQRRLVQALSEY